MKILSFLIKNTLPAILIFLSLILFILAFWNKDFSITTGPGALFGRIHPLLVHFPIVLIMIPLWLEGLRRLRNWPIDNRLIPLFLSLAIAAAFISALAGMVLYRSETYSGDLVNRHLWSGISLSVGMNLCGLALFFKKKDFFLSLLIVSNLFLLYTGHLGGSLTHGSDYLSELLPSWWEEKAPVEQKAFEELNVFEDIVLGIFEAKCMSCHNKQKARGKLILGSFEDLKKGGKSGEPLLNDSSLMASSLYRRIALPLEEEDHMPPEGKAQLSHTEKNLISWWIQSGGNPEQLVGQLSPEDSIRNILKDYLPSLAHYQKQQIKNRAERDKLAAKLVPGVEALGFEVEIDPESDSLLFALSMRFPATPITDASLVELLPYAHAISKISLVSAEITDEGLYTLSQMSSLRELILAKTCIDGSGLSYFSRLKKLEVLNISDTYVDNVQILNILRIPSLNQVYLYRSEVSLNVIDALQAFLPDTEIVYAEGDMY